MQLLANENFPRAAVESLRQRGHDVFWVRTDMAGATDEQILAHAQTEGRIVATYDKDFGELAFRSGLPAACGIILFRFSIPSPDAAAKRTVAVLESRSDWQGHFAVVDDFRVRMRPLPTRSS